MKYALVSFAASHVLEVLGTMASMKSLPDEFVDVDRIQVASQLHDRRLYADAMLKELTA